MFFLTSFPFEPAKHNFHFKYGIQNYERGKDKMRHIGKTYKKRVINDSIK